MKTGISPNWSLGVNIALAVLGVFAASGAYFDVIAGSALSKDIVMTAGFSVALLSAVNGVLHASSSAQGGALVKGD